MINHFRHFSDDSSHSSRFSTGKLLWVVFRGFCRSSKFYSIIRPVYMRVMSANPEE